MNVKTLLKTETFGRLPATMKEHKVFANIKSFNKPFKAIGLLNTLSENPISDKSLPEAYQKYRIGFSASGVKGLWDIATMSTRGVMSCMHWENPHSRHLIGSITDPFLGIIYLTDGASTPHGISFRKRCLVRLVYNTKMLRFRLMLERPYFDTGNLNPMNYANSDPDFLITLDVFKKYLAEKLSDKSIDVVSYLDRSYFDDYIPYYDGLNWLALGERSMSDCRLAYGPANKKNMREQDFELIAKCIKQI